MYRKTPLANATEYLIAYHLIKSVFGSYAKRAERKLEPIANDVYNRLRKGQTMPKEAPFEAEYRFERKDKKARTISEAVTEFKERYPAYGKRLQRLIDETRRTKQRYLLFGLIPEIEFDSNIYLKALREIGVPEQDVKSALENIMDMSENLKTKKEEGLNEMLIK